MAGDGGTRLSISAVDARDHTYSFPAPPGLAQHLAMPIDPTLFLAFLAAAWVLILTPGPDMLFVIGQSLAGGARRGWAAMAGIVTGAMVHVALAASGVAALIAASPLLFEA